MTDPVDEHLSAECAAGTSPPARRSDRPRHLESVPAGPADALAAARDRHPSAAMDRHLDTYFAAVARELESRGVGAGPPQRPGSAAHLSGSIAVDCSVVRADAPGDDRRPLPVVVAWDEDHGWVVGLRLDEVGSSCRLTYPDLLPAPADVAGFVVGLARAHPAADDVPESAAGSNRLRLLRDESTDQRRGRAGDSHDAGARDSDPVAIE